MITLPDAAAIRSYRTAERLAKRLQQRLSKPWTLHHADCRDVLRSLPDNSIDSVVTDPPYALVATLKRFANSPRNENTENLDNPYGRTGAGFMGQRWDTGEVAFAPGFWREVLRVLKPGGHVVSFGGTRTFHRVTCAIEDAGFEIRDSLMWIYGTGFPKSQNVAKFIDRELDVEGSLGGPRSAAHAEMLRRGEARRGEKHAGWDRPWMDNPEAVVAAQSVYVPGSLEAQAFDGFGTALKPAFEPIVLARAPLSEKSVAANVLKWGTGALNIDGCRIEAEKATGWGGGAAGGNTWTGENCGLAKPGDPRPTEGRWPANVVHDGSDEVVEAFPNSKGQQGDVRGTEPSGVTKDIYGSFSGRVPATKRNDSGSAARFFYSAKASKADRAGSKHPTVKPIALMAWLCRLITPPGGTVLDPFAGSGTTGAAALQEGFKVVLCEREDEFAEDIRRRLVDFR